MRVPGNPCIVVVLAIGCQMTLGCKAIPRASSSKSARMTLQSAIDATMADARRALDAHGVSETGLSEITKSLARLADTPGLIERAKLYEMHGSASMGRQTLASEGPDGVNLYLSRLAPGAKTPVHDHTTWGALHVIEGQDRYVRWERLDDGAVPGRANLRLADEQLLGSGDAVYWLPPPHDIHTQEAGGEVVWELVMTGRDLSHATASGHRNYFDLGTGEVFHKPPK